MWILYLKTDGTVKSYQKISCFYGGLGDVLLDVDLFGGSLAFLGDHDGPGGSVSTLAVGATGDDDGGSMAGAVHILFLTGSETVASRQKISQTTGGLGGGLKAGDQFGKSLANIGDLDGDGVSDLAVGAHQDDDGGLERGAVWILFLNTNGTVKAKQKISSLEGGFGGQLDDGDRFGYSLAATPDLNGDGIGDLAVGARYDDDGGLNRGALWLLFLDTDGTVKAERKISATAGGFSGVLDDVDCFGSSVTALGDHDGDGHEDLAVGALQDDDGGTDRGAMYVLFLDATTQASATWRNPSVGGSTNPDVYAVTGPPVVGGNFTASVDTTGPGGGAVLAGYGASLELTIGMGNLLVNPAYPGGEYLGLPLSLGDPALFSIPVPLDISLVDFTVASQAVRFDAGGLELTNAQDLVVGW